VWKSIAASEALLSSKAKEPVGSTEHLGRQRRLALILWIMTMLALILILAAAVVLVSAHIPDIDMLVHHSRETIGSHCNVCMAYMMVLFYQ
jgi:predicted nucleic acid-binding Zn ribbon protein